MLVFAIAAVCCVVSGQITNDQGAPIPAATISASGGQTVTAVAGIDGRFATMWAPGHYRVIIRARGYGTTEIDDVAIVHDGETIDATLLPLSSERLRTIGKISVDGRLAVPRGAVPSETILRETMDQQGLARAIDAIDQVPSAVLTRPDGGNAASPVVVSLRGPDPSETLVTLDGQVINNTNTGDVDVGQFVPAAFGAVDVSEGLGPTDNSGANTIGGEVNFVSLMPTREPHANVLLSAGSFGSWTYGGDMQGMLGRFGYALALQKNGTTGYVHGYSATLLQSNASSIDALPIALGSWVDATTGLANLSYRLSDRADVHVRLLSLQNARDESAARNSPAEASRIAAYLQQQQSGGAPIAPGPYFQGGGSQVASQNLQAALIVGRLPIGPATLSLSYAGSSNGLTNVGAAETPYEFSNVDRIGTATAQYDTRIGAADVTLGDYVRAESLTSPQQFTTTLREHSASAFARVSVDATPRLHLGATMADTVHSTFGGSVDWRLGVMYALPEGAVARIGVGTGFRAPLLSERYVVPANLLVPDQNCVAPNGNPNLVPEHATEYELGYGRRFGTETTADATVYWTNLRSPIENFYPLGTMCPSGGSTVVAQSFPVNVGNVVYHGASIALARRFGSLFARAEYGLNAAYPTSLPADFVANPTSGSNLVPDQQFSGIPLHTGTLELNYSRSSGVHADAYVVYRAGNNELNQGPYALVGAAIGKRLSNGLDFTLAGTNLTSAVSGPFTLIGAGVPYLTPAGLVPRNALFLEPASIRLIVSYKR